MPGTNLSHGGPGMCLLLARPDTEKTNPLTVHPTKVAALDAKMAGNPAKHKHAVKIISLCA